MKHLYSFLLFSIIIICSNHNISAQIDSFNLELYKLPQLERHQLDFKFAAGNSMSDDYIEDMEFPEEKIQLNASHIYFSTGLETRYLGYFNSRDYQGDQEIRMNVSGTHNNGKRKESSETTYSNFNNVEFGFSGNSTNRFYFKNLYFVETDLYLSSLNFSFYNESSSPDTTSNESLVKTESQNIEGSLPLKVGKGRIEPVQDARMAVYIMDQLSERGKLNRKPSKDEILSFAREIAEIKNERFFDARNRRIYELTRLDSFLTKHNFLDDTDIEYFTTINDYWQYANNPKRSSGSRFSVGVEPWYVYQHKYDKEETLIGQIAKNTYHNKYYGIRGLLEYDYEKPHNLYWQSSFHGMLSYGSEVYKHNDNQSASVTRYSRQALNTSLQYTLGWYPDSRSYYSYYIQGYYHHFFQEDDEFKSLSDYRAWGEETDYLFRTGFSGYYYFSPRLRFSGGFSLFHRNVNQPLPEMEYYSGILQLKKKDWDFLINFSIEYSFF